MFPLKCRLLSWPTLPGLFPLPILSTCSPALSLTEVLSPTKYTTPFLLQGLALAAPSAWDPVPLLGLFTFCSFFSPQLQGDLFWEASLHTHTHPVSIPLHRPIYTIFNTAFSPYPLMDYQLLLSPISSVVNSMLIFFERTMYKMWTGEGYF